MSKISGLIEWFKTYPAIKDVEEIDVSQLDQTGIAAGLYKQPSVTVQQLIDGSEIRTENYYLLLRRNAQLRDERVDNEDYLEEIENWIFDQEMSENYPDIGYPVHSVAMSSAFYMMSRDEDASVYQFAVAVTYEKGSKKND